MQQIDLRALDLNLLLTFEMLMSEGNVTRAARRLGRSQSAVSHALGRLREQLDDPLMVRVGGRMEPTPFASRLIGDVRPLLESLARVLAPQVPFEPTKSTRTFRIAGADFAPTLFTRLVARVQAAAPRVRVDWMNERADTPRSVAEGSVDAAVLAASTPFHEGLRCGEPIDAPWATFLREGHPAADRFGPAAWRRYGHVIVQIDNSLRSPVQESAPKRSRDRHIAARALSFSAVAPLLAESDLVATFPVVLMHRAAEQYGLRCVRPPFPIKPFPHQLIWSARLDGDPANRWIRTMLQDCFAEIVAESASLYPASAGGDGF